MIDDPVVRWVAGQPGAVTWERPGAIAVACADLYCRDRLAIGGEPEAVASLLAEVVPRVGPTYCPVGAEDLVTDVVGRVPALRAAGRFGWMDVTAPVPARGRTVPRSARDVTMPAGDAAPPMPAGEVTAPMPVGEVTAPMPVGDAAAPVPVGEVTAPETRASWLREDELPQVTALIEEVFPESYAKPGGPGVRRWAGVRGDDGMLLAVAADAWSTGEVGLVAGVATRAEARGRGLAREVCAFVTNELITGRDRVALLVDYWNVAALTAYGKLGFVLSPLAAARIN